jgi:hypothetical protein
MSRDLASAAVTEISKNSIGEPILFADLDFPSGFVRAHTSLGTINWGGFDWLGVGTLGSVSAVEETSELQRRTLVYTLTGIPSAMISIVLGENYQGRKANLYLGFKDPATGLLVATPDLLDSGLLDVSEIEEGDTISVTITAESRVAQWDRPVVRRYTDTDQKSRFPGDRGLEFIDQAAQKEINWGRRTV